MNDNVKPPLIAHVIFQLGMGGLENGLINLINRMPSDAFRHVIICMTDATDFSERLNKPVEIYSLHKKEGKDLWIYFKLWKLFRKLKPEIVHTRNLSALEAQLAAALAGVPIRVHGEHGRDVHDLDGSNKRYQLIRKFFRILIDRYIPLSQDLSKYLIETIQVNPDKVVKICNGVDTDKFKPDSYFRGNNDHSEYPDFLLEDKSITEKSLEKKTIVFGTVGRLATVKNQTDLLKAFNLLCKENPEADIKLVIVGDGGLKKDLLDIMQAEKLDNKVWLAGARNNVNELMNMMDVFVLPSLAEGISNTILEAMATGLPVVATDVGGNAELVVNNETGYIVAPANINALKDGLKNYLDRPERIKQQGKQSRKRIENNFSINEMMQNYLQTYQTLINEKL